jgi:hypothetical protein
MAQALAELVSASNLVGPDAAGMPAAGAAYHEKRAIAVREGQGIMTDRRPDKARATVTEERWPAIMAWLSLVAGIALYLVIVFVD